MGEWPGQAGPGSPGQSRELAVLPQPHLAGACRPWRWSLLSTAPTPGLPGNWLQETRFVDAEPAGGAGTYLAHRLALLASSPSWEKPSAWGREQETVRHTERVRPRLTRAPGTE